MYTMTGFFVLLYLVCVAALFFAAYFLIKKFSVKHLRLTTIVSISLACLLIIFSVIFPFVANATFVFPSPQSAFSYLYFEEPSLVIDGNKSTFLLSSPSRDSQRLAILHKTDKGWKQSNLFDVKIAFSDFIDDCYSVSVWSCKNSSDSEYYMIIEDLSKTCQENFLDITDDKNSLFHRYVNTPDSLYVTYLAYIGSYDTNSLIDYHFYINGKRIDISFWGDEDVTGFLPKKR